MFNFMGASIIQQVVRDLVPLGLENSTHLMLTGSSAGGTGVMINLDAVKELLHERLGLKHIALRGVSDSGWFLDRIPYAPTGKPAVDAIRKGINYWQGKVPKRCKQKYPTEPWRCYFGYRIYNTLKSKNAIPPKTNPELIFVTFQRPYSYFNGCSTKPKWTQITLDLR